MRDMSERQGIEETLRHRSEQLTAANAELARAARLKDEFLASMSHELRTPLNGILAMSEGLQEQVYGTLNPAQISADAGRRGMWPAPALPDQRHPRRRQDRGRQDRAAACPVLVESLCRASLRMVKDPAHRRKSRVTL